MARKTKELLLEHVGRLIDEGTALLGTKRDHPGGSTQKVTWVGSPSTVDSQLMSKWLSGCANLVFQMGQIAATWEGAFAPTRYQGFEESRRAMGRLEALRDAIQHDMLFPVEDLMFGEAFANLLEQATELLQSGYPLASGVLGRAVLETHLRKLCDHHGCLPSGNPTIETLKQALVKAKVLSSLTAHYVDAMGTAGNHCAHNKQPPLSKADIEKLLSDVQDVVAKTPLS